MDTSVLTAIIGVGGVIVGVGIGETLQWIHRRQSTREKEMALRGSLIGLYHEMRQNRSLAGDLKKLEIRTYANDPSIVQTAMLGDVRRYYAHVDASLIDAVESAYADLQELVHLVDTGPSDEHKKWVARGNEVYTSVANAMKQLRQRVSELAWNLQHHPTRRCSRTALRAAADRLDVMCQI